MNEKRFVQLLRFVNEAQTEEELVEHLRAAGGEAAKPEFAADLLAKRASAGGVFRKVEDLRAAGLSTKSLTAVAKSVEETLKRASRIEPERLNFKSLVLKNPNYFGNLEDSPLQPVTPIQGNTRFEELECVGLNPPYDRLEAVVRIKRNSGYGGDVCSTGSFEYVRFYVDLHDNGVFHDVGLGSVRVFDITGPKPLCYAVLRDFDSIRKFCLTENVVRVRAILSWNVPPPANSPNFVPVWGNRLDASVQIRPRLSFSIGEIVKEFELAEVEIPDPVGPVIKAIDPETLVSTLPEAALQLAEKREKYQEAEVPAARFAFPEAVSLTAAPGGGEVFALDKSPLAQLGLEVEEIDNLFELIQSGDGDTSFEELKCIGLKPELDLLEGVLTVKKNLGYSGSLCSPGSTEYVAFWIDFGDGAGFTHVGTSSVRVHDLKVPAGGLQYAVFLKTNLLKRLTPCQFGARVVRLRAILSWENPPPPGNPGWTPTWGNRLDCRIQLRPGQLKGHIPLIETVGDVGVNDINPANGLATGVMPIAGVTLNQSPFGRGVSITGRIGDPPNTFGGGAQPFKYRIEVAPSGTNDWQPLTNKITVKKSEWINGIPQQCAPGDFVCDLTLTPTDDGDGLGPGWYSYIEDLTPPHQRFLVLDQLARWDTNENMEGLWKIRMTAKDPSTSPPTVFPGIQIVRVRIDNSGPTVSLAITGAVFNGNPLPAVDCGKFPVGTIISGTFSVQDPGHGSSAAAFQHYNNTTFEVLPSGPAAGAAPTTVPAVRTFPAVSTTGIAAGTWTLKTAGMKACGYVLRMVGSDRTNVNSRGNHFRTPIAVGFCLE